MRIFMYDQRRNVHSSGAAIHPIDQSDAHTDADTGIDRCQQLIVGDDHIRKIQAQHRDVDRVDEGAQHCLQKECLSQTDRSQQKQADRQYIDDERLRQMQDRLQCDGDAGRPSGEDVGRQNKKSNAQRNDQIADQHKAGLHDPFLDLLVFHDIPHFRRLSLYHRTAGDAHVLPFAKCSFRKAIRFWMLSCVIELFGTMS